MAWGNFCSFIYSGISNNQQAYNYNFVANGQYIADDVDDGARNIVTYTETVCFEYNLNGWWAKDNGNVTYTYPDF